MPQLDALQADWARDGYVVLPGWWDAESVHDIELICDSVRLQWLAAQADAEQAAALINMAELTQPGYFRHDPARLLRLLEQMAEPRILALLEALFDVPLLFHNSQYFFEPARAPRAGDWHRDAQFATADPVLEQTYMDNTIGVHLHVALVPDDRLELVPGSHARPDSPVESAIRYGRDGHARSSDAMPGAQRIRLQAGDACLFSAWMLHRGHYGLHPPRRTFDVIYGSRAEWACPSATCFGDAALLEQLSPHAARFYARHVEAYQHCWAKAL